MWQRQPERAAYATTPNHLQRNRGAVKYTAPSRLLCVCSGVAEAVGLMYAVKRRNRHH